VGQYPVSLPAPQPVPEGPSPLDADNIIKNHVILAMSAGLIPSPIVDMLAVTLIEVNMIAKLAKAYSFPTPHRLVTYKVLVALAGGVVPVWLGFKFHGLVKNLPLIGHAIYLGTLSISGGASVYAVGKLFQKHFESGGTFLTGQNAILKHYFQEKHQEGKTLVPQMLRDAASRAS
jgi:uncharacterized protein (DUF697 family)